MKLVIQIPCWNEENSLAETLADLPREVAGFDRVEWLIVDDGSSDGTIDVARRCGVDHVVALGAHRGLARAFTAGIEAALAGGADVIVNTDADNQYRAADIPRLVSPILDGSADIVIGARAMDAIAHFSPLKKFLERLGSRVVRIVSGTEIGDAPSGFRAISRRAALRLNVFSDYTYTLETIIQAGREGLRTVSVPVGTNGYRRPSRLVASTARYVWRSATTILGIFLIYRPVRFFAIIGSIPFSLGMILAARWVILRMLDAPTSHVPSLVVGAVLVLVGVQLWVLGLVAYLIAINRKLLENIQLHQRRGALERRADAGDLPGIRVDPSSSATPPAPR